MSLNDTQILDKWNNSINGCICLTEWHKNLFIEKGRIHFHSKLTFAFDTALARNPLRFQVPEYESG